MGLPAVRLVRFAEVHLLYLKTISFQGCKLWISSFSNGACYCCSNAAWFQSWHRHRLSWLFSSVPPRKFRWIPRLDHYNCLPDSSNSSIHQLALNIITHALTEPSWEAASCAATQGLPSILWNQKVPYRVHWSLSWARSIQSIPSHSI
jgi:hypothetical protein